MLWPFITQTSPMRRFSSSIFSSPQTTVSFCAVARAGRAGNVTSHRPVPAAAVASAFIAELDRDGAARRAQPRSESAGR
jgi:hypothetical protein